MIYVVTNCEGKIQPIAKSFGASGMSAPIGSITPGFAENEKWKFCEGQRLLKKDYPVLFSIIGYTYGGEGDYFNLPDMREYVPCGAGKRASNTSEEMILGKCYESQFGSHTHSQNSHNHATSSHCHNLSSHCHFICEHRHNYCGCYLVGGYWCLSSFYDPSGSYNVCVNTIRCLCCATTTIPNTSSTFTGNSSSNTITTNATTAVNCATGCADGITRGRRYGLRYLVRVA